MKRFLSVALFFLLASPVFADDIRFSVVEVKDSRTTGQFFAGLDLKLRAMGDIIADAKGLKIDVTKALDDTGRDLLKKDGQKCEEFTKPDENNTSQADIELKLKNPARKAAVVREVAGEISVFMPKRDPNATATVKAFVTHTGKPIEEKALKAAGVGLSVMTKKQFDEFKEQQKKEVKSKEGEMVREFGEAMTKALQSLFGGFMEIGENSIILDVTDPGNKVVSIEFSDATGKALRSGSSMKTGDIRVFEFNEPVPQDAQLTIYLATPKSMVKMPFSITDIALP
ncbi:MAG: hypothetical protein M0024_15065 [Nitrospiraceae bacterium]|nr:hypothetical protein [Nitrospiraceae bacterium]